MHCAAIKNVSLTCFGYVTARTFFARGTVLTYEKLHPIKKFTNKFLERTNREHNIILCSGVATEGWGGLGVTTPPIESQMTS